MAKNDSITAWVDLGAGQTQELKVRATKGGRRVRARNQGKFTFLEEVAGRGQGSVVRKVRFLTARLVAQDESFTVVGTAPAANKPAAPRKPKAKKMPSPLQMDLEASIEEARAKAG